MNLNLKTERLTIKPATENDIADIFHLQSLEETAKYNTSGIPKSIDETRSTVQNWIIENNQENIKKLIFKVEINETNQFIGLIGITLGKEHYKNAEVWFQYDFRFWNKGFATESLRKIIEF